MSYTLTQKILMKNAGVRHVEPGDVIITHPDYHTLLPSDSRTMHRMGFYDVFDKDRVLSFCNHDVPPSDQRNLNILVNKISIVKRFGLTHHFDGQGICHSIVPEKKLCRPGMVMFGCDSHTCTYGAAACFSSGIGTTDGCALAGSGELWVRVPAGIKIVIDGDLPRGVYSKDVILTILGDIHADGAQYKSIEFCGSTIRKMSMWARFTMTNMAVECGAKNGIIEADKVTADYFDMNLSEIEWLKCGPDDAYERVLHYDASKFVPMVACPRRVDNVKPVTEVAGTKLTQVFFGSCTNTSLEDFGIFDGIIKGRKVGDKYLKLLVSPGTIHQFTEAVALGYMQDILEAGGIVTNPKCGICYGGCFGLMDKKGVMLGTNNRNFIGRHGDREAQTYLGSPATAAASAITGVLTDPREFLS